MGWKFWKRGAQCDRCDWCGMPYSGGGVPAPDGLKLCSQACADARAAPPLDLEPVDHRRRRVKVAGGGEEPSIERVVLEIAMAEQSFLESVGASGAAGAGQAGAMADADAAIAMAFVQLRKAAETLHALGADIERFDLLHAAGTSVDSDWRHDVDVNPMAGIAGQAFVRTDAYVDSGDGARWFGEAMAEIRRLADLVAFEQGYEPPYRADPPSPRMLAEAEKMVARAGTE